MTEIPLKHPASNTQGTAVPYEKENLQPLNEVTFWRISLMTTQPDGRGGKYIYFRSFNFKGRLFEVFSMMRQLPADPRLREGHLAALAQIRAGNLGLLN